MKVTTVGISGSFTLKAENGILSMISEIEVKAKKEEKTSTPTPTDDTEVVC